MSLGLAIRDVATADAPRDTVAGVLICATCTHALREAVVGRRAKPRLCASCKGAIAGKWDGRRWLP